MHGSLDFRSPVSVDATTGPHVSVSIQLPPHHQNKHCTLVYGLNSTLQSTSSNSSVREDGYEIKYTLHPLIAGMTYGYNVSCSVEFREFRMGKKVHVFKFTENGTFIPGISYMHSVLVMHTHAVLVIRYVYTWKCMYVHV